MMTNYLDSTAHMLIVGATGAGPQFGGKTVTANYLCEQSYINDLVDMAIFFNAKGHGFVRGEHVNSLSELVEAYGNGARHINYVPRNDSEAEHEQLIRALRDVPGRKLLVHDETHDYADSEALKWCFKQGGNVEDSTRYETGDIRSIAVTQHPWDIPQKVAQNAPLIVVVGAKNPNMRSFFENLKIQDAYDEIPQDRPNYAWSVINGGEYVETNGAVPEGYANA